MNTIKFGARMAEVMPLRMAPNVAPSTPTSPLEPSESCDIAGLSNEASAIPWTPQLAAWQENFGAQGTSVLVGIAQQVGRELVTPQTEANWAKRTAFADSTYDNSINPRLNKICGQLREVSSLSDLKLNPILEEKQSFNARATGGGLINITQGLVHLFDRAAARQIPDDEPRRSLTSQVADYFQHHGLDKNPDLVLAAVLAHEIGHIENRDLAANWGQQILSEQLGVCATGAAGQSARGLLLELPETLQQANWDMEFRADQRGAQLLEKAGYPREGMKHMLNVLGLIETAMKKPSSDQDHPPLKDRLARLELL